MRSPPETRAGRRPGRDVLLYDDGCACCRASAAWLARRARRSLTLLPISAAQDRGLLEELGERELWASAHFVTAAGVEYHGGAAMTQALRLGPGGRAWALLDLAPLSWLRDAGYALAVRLRGRIACAPGRPGAPR